MLLEIGYNSEIEVREETIQHGLPREVTVMYISDLHLNRFGSEMVRRIVFMVAQYQPDILLLGGDYVDTRKGMQHLQTLLQALQGRENVLAIAGNHDYFYGINVIQKMMHQHGVAWIEKSSAHLQVKGFSIQIDGNVPSKKREKADFHILSLHQPTDIKAIQNPFNLILAGHLHGSQVVLWQNERGLYPGKLFYKWNLLRKKVGGCLYLVSKGVSDTLPVRFNCRRDVLVVRIK